MDIDARLAQFPRVDLGHWPTPLQPADKLQAVIGGPPLWFKRDDCSGLALGGNKVRKLEFLIGRALAEGADGVVTVGALQSNHARQTAAACARFDLPCDLILTRIVDRHDEHYERSGNVLLDQVLGARLHVVDDAESALVRFAELDAEASADGRTLFGIGPGGSDAVGVLGYVAGGLELAAQVRALDLDAGRVVVAASTAGTAAGLVLGLALADLDIRVDAVCVYDPAVETSDAMDRLLAEGAAALGCEVPGPERWRVAEESLGDGYGIATSASHHSIGLVAKTEGVLLDPVYTAKAMSKVIADAWGAHPDHTDGRATIFLHTGGAPGLFAYAPAFGG